MLEEITNRRSPLGEIVSAVLTTWPEHTKFLAKSFVARPKEMMATTELAAAIIRSMAADRLVEHTQSYRWTCDQLTREVRHFLKSGRYRSSSFADVNAAVYSNRAFMGSYLEGLLLSQVLWVNHAAVIDQFIRRFVPKIPSRADCLEVGPGHGLFTALLANNTAASRLCAWDVSPDALETTRANLTRAGLALRVALELRDIAQPLEVETRFDAIIASEVLEHLENPVEVLGAIRCHLKPQGRLFVNIPVNSPAPDHIVLLRSPEEAKDLIEDNGFVITDFSCHPVTGHTEEEARAERLTLSCVIIAKHRDGDD